MTGRRAIWIAGLGLAVVLALFGIQLCSATAALPAARPTRAPSRAA
jgi:hypothetical protein